MNVELRCTIHNVEYGFNVPDGIEHSRWNCPQCQYEMIVERVQTIRELTKQRDLLLAAIDLKRLQLPHEAADKQ